MGRTREVIDLEPAFIASVVKQNDYVSVICAGQPVWPQELAGAPAHIPLFDCEMRILNGAIEIITVDLPYESAEWQIEFAEGSLRCFLPTDFSVTGSVLLRIGSVDSPGIVIAGTGAKLFLRKQVGVIEITPCE